MANGDFDYSNYTNRNTSDFTTILNKSLNIIEMLVVEISELKERIKEKDEKINSLIRQFSYEKDVLIKRLNEED